MSDLISRQAAIDRLTEYGNGRAVFISVGEAIIRIEQLPPVQHEPHEIGYDDCSNALLKMWMDNVLTDGEYYRIADKLNEKWGKTVLPEPYKGVTE